MRRRSVAISLALVGGWLVLALLFAGRQTDPTPHAAPSASAKPVRIPMIDTHVHLSSGGVERLLGLMQRYGFDHIVNLSGGWPGHGLARQLDAARRSGGRITVFTVLAYPEAEEPGFGQRMAALVRRAHAMGARGLKIHKVLGLALRDPEGKLIPVDDPRLDPVFETCGELGMPVAIHSGDPQAFWKPVDKRNERYDELTAHPGWSEYGRAVPGFDDILAALKRRIARHPKTIFIAVHFGNDAEHPDRVARMLDTYPNMYIDTAARIPELGRHDPDAMRAFFIKYQDRILFGSDLGVGPEPEPLFLGSSGSEPPTPAEERLFFSATHRWFETADRNFPGPTPIQGKWTISGIHLPRAVLEKVYYKNADRLLGITLPGRG